MTTGGRRLQLVGGFLVGGGQPLRAILHLAVLLTRADWHRASCLMVYFPAPLYLSLRLLLAFIIVKLLDILSHVSLFVDVQAIKFITRRIV